LEYKLAKYQYCGLEFVINNMSLNILLKRQGFRVLYSGTWSYPVDLASIIKYIFHRNTLKNIKTNSIEIATNHKSSIIKKLKILLFDIMFCRTFYRLLNYNKGGSILEVIAQKL
jgi:hypothetical protein